ncbi:hypothetical protein [Flexibacterium corallicola]|uniref:hypothetical protein n=1 Tax=Flexibacterium corallicola TaxID=3037259 RepID=UPI00286F7F95|nr:hypothetical protein [Pseudovibrio sp. M1P-2-3]
MTVGLHRNFWLIALLSVAVTSIALAPTSFAMTTRGDRVYDTPYPQNPPHLYGHHGQSRHQAEDTLLDNKVYFSLGGENRLPSCDSMWTMYFVKSAIGNAVYPYYGGLRVRGVEHIKETGYRLGNPSPVARRYCAGTANLSNGTQRAIYYKIIEHDGFLGLLWGVEACLLGLDKFRVYDGKCRTVRIEYFYE